MTPNGLNQPSAKQQVVSLLRDLASQIQKMDDSEVESVLAGESRGGAISLPPTTVSRQRRS